ncbi:mgm101p [Saccharomyces arboricola H-6]|uniref:Mitochondrial genome maintenance protein MGM101 n=1 Tax=Saccharomyces arboricola (strain H-6 / AS 2.3317 / CBS 10644) TaxID=1160507 RepID=J8Q3A7_SACAR|nr:mgm101p [Saccharomyces arboricola H-6]
MKSIFRIKLRASHAAQCCQIRTVVSGAGATTTAGPVKKSFNSTETKSTFAAKPEVGNGNSMKEYSSGLNSKLSGTPLETRSTPDDTLKGSHTPARGDIDWYTSWYGLGMKPFEAKVQKELIEPLNPKDIEVKPDGLIYLPEIKYRRILNRAFGAGGWGLVPRSQTIVTSKLVTREYGLICHGQLISVARGEQDYFNESGIPTATEGCKSNALMRCCKDLGVGSELWDPVFIKKFKVEHCTEKFVEHVTTKRKKKIWLRKDRQVEYPYK